MKIYISWIDNSTDESAFVILKNEGSSTVELARIDYAYGQWALTGDGEIVTKDITPSSTGERFEIVYDEATLGSYTYSVKSESATGLVSEASQPSAVVTTYIPTTPSGILAEAAPAAPSEPIISNSPAAPSEPILNSNPAAPSEPILNSSPAAPSEPILNSSPASPSTIVIENVSVSELWTPEEITSELWFDSDDLSTITIDSSNRVSNWNDKSGNDIHALQTSTSQRPSLVANGPNGLSTLQFDGINDFIVAPALNINQAYTIYSVAKSTGGTGRDYLFDGIGSNTARSLIALRRNSAIYMWAGQWQYTGTSSPSGFFTLSAVFDNASSTFSSNGTMTATGINPGSGSLTNGINIGTNYLHRADFLAGNIAEFIIVDGVASASERQKIEGYLAHKWGLDGDLPSGHPYKNYAPLSGYVSTGPTAPSSITATASTLSGGYVYTSTFGPDTASYSIDEFGKISVTGGSNQTANLFYEDSILNVGDTVSVKISDAPPSENYLTISTTNRAPNTGYESGIRLRWNSSGEFTARRCIGGSQSNIDFHASFDATNYVTLYVTRESNTTFSASFDDGSGLENLNTTGGTEKQILTIDGLNSDPLFIGIETWHNGNREFIDFGTENLGRIISGPTAPSSITATIPASTYPYQSFTWSTVAVDSYPITPVNLSDTWVLDLNASPEGWGYRPSTISDYGAILYDPSTNKWGYYNMYGNGLSGSPDVLITNSDVITDLTNARMNAADSITNVVLYNSNIP